MDYPVGYQLDAPLKVANWRPLVQWILAIPQLFVANVLGQVAELLALISWFIILFTGRMPEGMANFMSMALRYQHRAYSYAMFLREPYPPFDFTMTGDDPGGDPLRVDIRPQLENRNRLTVGLRFLWIIPIALFLALVGIAMFFVMIIAFFAVLFTGAWPEGLRSFVIGVERLAARVGAYAYLLVDDYPPFRIEEPSAPSQA
jgi:hypothetical protein